MTISDMSLGGAVLIAVILLLRRAALHRLPKWTFLLLWGVALCRLLIPFAIPSPVSIYSGAEQLVRTVEVPAAPAPSPGAFSGAAPGPPSVPVPPPIPEAPAPAVERPESVSPVRAVHRTGLVLCALFFTAAYLRCLRRFRGAVPAEGAFFTRWLADHPAFPPIRIKVCAGTPVPLACGILRPAILLPPGMLADEDRLACVLTHEYIHIRRMDPLWKLLLAGAVCLHWFNPLVWAMYFCANRDLELACDEAAVRLLGPDCRRRYALALLSAAEEVSFPLCTTFAAQNHLEERIRAIMKYKRHSAGAVFAAALLVAVVTAVFATSCTVPDTPEITLPPQTPPVAAPGEGDASAARTPEQGEDPGNSSAVQTPEQGEDPGDSSTVRTPEPDEKEPPAVQTEKPAKGEAKPVSDTAGNISNQNSSSDTPDEPGGGTPAAQTPESPAPENRWGVPDDPIPENTEIPAANRADAEDMVEYLKNRTRHPQR